MHKIQPYAKSRDVWLCPSAPEINANIGANNGTGAFGCNRNLMESGRGRPLSDLKNVAGTFIICDTSQLTGKPQDELALNVEKWHRPPYQASGPSSGERNPYTDWQVAPPSGFKPGPGTGNVDGYYNANRYLYTEPIDANGDNHRRPAPRHSLGVNIIYADGHAKWQRITQFLGIPNNGVDPVPSVKGWLYGHPNNTWDDQ